MLSVAEICFLDDAAIVANMVWIQRKNETGGKPDKSRAGNVQGQEEEEQEEQKEAVAQTWRAMLCADNAGTASQSPDEI